MTTTTTGNRSYNITAPSVTITAVSLQWSVPVPREIRGYRGIPVVPITVQLSGCVVMCCVVYSAYKLSVHVNEVDKNKPLQISHFPQILGSESTKVAQTITVLS